MHAKLTRNDPWEAPQRDQGSRRKSQQWGKGAAGRPIWRGCSAGVVLGHRGEMIPKFVESYTSWAEKAQEVGNLAAPGGVSCGRFQTLRRMCGPKVIQKPPGSARGRPGDAYESAKSCRREAVSEAPAVRDEV